MFPLLGDLPVAEGDVRRRPRSRSPHVVDYAVMTADTLPTAACRIYLVRHGRTVLNVEKRFRGRLEIPLDEKGRREALLAAAIH